MSEIKPKHIVAVTGATGFIGKQVVKKLLEKGYFVKILSRKAGQKEAEGTSVVVCDNTDKKTIENAFDCCKAVIHLAAKVPQIGVQEDYKESYKQNVLAAINVFSEAEKNGVEKFIFISGWHVYGENDWKFPIKETEKINTSTVYSKTKAEAEKLLLEKSATAKMKLLILRISNLYGESPSQEGVIIKFIKKSSDGQQIEVSGNQSRDYLYVGDAADAIINALVADTKETIFNIGSGKPLTIIKIAETVRRIYKKFGMWTPEHKIYLGKGQESIKFLDISKAKKMLKFRPQTSFEDGIEKTILWWESQKPRKIKAIIFDLDGTLLDVTERYAQGYIEAAKKMSLQIPEKEKIIELKKFGLTGFEILKTIYQDESDEKIKQTDELRIRITNSHELICKDKPYQAARNTLKKIKESSFKTAVVTLRPKEFNKQIKDFGLSQFIDLIINESSKEKTNALIKASKKIGVSTFDCIAIGDSPADIIQAKNIGMKTIAAEYALIGKERLAKENPNYFAKNLNDIEKIVNIL